MPGIREYISACEYRANFLQEQIQWLREERSEFNNEVERLQNTEARVRQELVGYLLPDVNDEHIAHLETRLSYPGLRPIKDKYEAKFSAAEARRIEIEAMDEYQHYDLLVDRAERAIEDVRPKFESMREDLLPWEGSRWFLQLNKRNYFAIDYKANWWHRFLNWRAVSLLMAHLSKRAGLKFQHPDELKAHYRQLRSEADDVFAAHEKRTAERDRIVAIKTEHRDLLSAPERLMSELFNELGEATITHLDACPAEVREELAKGDAHLHTFLRKLTGMRKQVQYLRELPVTRIDERIQQVTQDLDKTKAKIRKLQMQKRRGKVKRYSNNDLARMRNVKADKWQRRREKTAKLRNKVARFDKYDRGSISDDFLWWDVMTGAAAADDLFEVREFRSRNPNWDYNRFHDPIDDHVRPPEITPFDDAADELGAAMSMEPNDDTFFDPS